MQLNSSIFPVDCLLWPLPRPHIASSPPMFFLCLFWVQSLNLLEPRDPACYVNGAYSNTLVPGRINLPSTTLSLPLSLPLTHSASRTHIGLYRAKLGFAAFGSRPTFPLSPQLRRSLMQCLHELPVTTKSKAYPCERWTVRGQGGTVCFCMNMFMLPFTIGSFSGANYMQFVSQNTVQNQLIAIV